LPAAEAFKAMGSPSATSPLLALTPGRLPAVRGRARSKVISALFVILIRLLSLFFIRCLLQPLQYRFAMLSAMLSAILSGSTDLDGLRYCRMLCNILGS